MHFEYQLVSPQVSSQAVKKITAFTWKRVSTNEIKVYYFKSIQLIYS